MKGIAVILLVFMMGMEAAAQSSNSTSPVQIWPEVDIYYRLNDKWRLYSKISSTRLNEANTDGTLGAYVDYFALPWLREKYLHRLNDSSRGSYLWFRLGYSYSQSPPDAAKLVHENIIVTEVNAQYKIPWDILLTNTNRFDWMYDNGQFDPRYRLKLKFDRNFSTAFLFFNVYFFGEYYFYFNNNDQDRFRLQIGYQVKVTQYMNLETYYLHQFPNDGTVSAVDAIGLQANLFFSKKTKKKRQD